MSLLTASNTTGLYFLDARERYVYHYTRAETALRKILPYHQLRMGAFKSTNDPRESKDWLFGFGTNSSFNGVSGKEWSRLTHEATFIAKDTCKLLCLTEDDAEALGHGIDKIYGRGFCRSRMWAQYAQNHAGVCLIFDRSRLREAIKASIESSSLLFEGSVTYRNRSQASPLINDPFIINFDSIRVQGLLKSVFEHVSRYWRELFFEKVKDWADEREFRWVAWDTKHEHHFVDFGDALKGVVVGPDFHELHRRKLTKFGKEYDLQVAQLNWKNGVPEVLPAFWPVGRP